MKLKIAIVGTRGIPNHYGGFEQITTFLSEGLVNKGHHVTVYNSHNHPFREREYKGVEIRHCYDPEYIMGTAGQFVYDLNCIMDARKQDYDVLVFMGYTSSSVWAKLFPGTPVVISNMDGFEWKRAKYSRPVQKFLRYAEKLAVKNSHFHIADSKPMQQYLQENYAVDSCYIPYGATLDDHYSDDLINEWMLTEGNYMLAIARMEPENNLEMILEGYIESGSEKKMVIVGNTAHAYGRNLVKQYASGKVVFTNSIFDSAKLYALRKGAAIYFHGHSVGGTNPSLLEAMAAGCLVAAHDNPFNRAVLNDEAFYFSSVPLVSGIIRNLNEMMDKQMFIDKNMRKIEEHYNWKRIIEAYEFFILSSYKRTKK